MMRKTPTDNNNKPRLPIKVTKCGQMKLKAPATIVDAPKEEEKKEKVVEADEDDDSAGELRGDKKEVITPSSSIMDRSKGIKKETTRKEPIVKKITDVWDEEDKRISKP